MSIWIDLLVSFSPWLLLIAEVYLGKRVYEATQRKSLLHQKITQLRLLASSLKESSQGGHDSEAASRGASDTPPPNSALFAMLREQLPAIPSQTWQRLATLTVVASVFALVYFGMSILLRPFANHAVLTVLPLWLPLATLPVPYLLSMKPRPTLLVIVAVLGLSFLTFFLTGV